jgi:hypothetical protein
MCKIMHNISNVSINLAKDYRILFSIAKHGVDVIPYDFEFLNKYGLKQLFLTYMDLKTSPMTQKIVINILKKHICEAAVSVLPDDIRKFDNLILESFSSQGFEFINTFFNNLDSNIKNDFLFQYSLFKSYREFMDSINYPNVISINCPVA